MERVGGRQEKMEGHFSTGQSPQWAIVPMEEERRLFTWLKIIEGVWVAQSVQWLAAGWTVSGLESRQRHGILSSPKVARPSLEPTQPPTRWVPGLFSEGKVIHPNIIHPSTPGETQVQIGG